ncbi:MAG TPA: hypothetical protein VFV85_09620, partial [Conexibacter sp.]|nr:hypothetical protein [Conexibacter sp.]
CVVASAPIDPRLEREVISSAALAHALEVTARVGERLPVALSGGVLTPEDATAATEAGAGLIALSNGFVFAGPGLPQRINRRLDVGRTLPLDGADDANGDGDGHALGAVGAAPPASEPAPRAAATTTAERAGGLLLTVAAAAMLLIGAGYLVLAFTAKLLPNDTAHLGFGVAQLCTLDSCRIVHFISHDAAVYAGITLANGTLLTWIGRGPLRRREPWAWWAIALALIPLLLGFLSFLAYGYFNTVHAGMVAVVLVLLAAGLVLTRGVASGWRPHEALRAAAVRAWIWSPAGRGRYLLLGLALSTLLGGLAIVAIASTRVFVPEDLEYLRLSAHQVHAISPRLVPVMAHDRAEFGGGLMMFGVLLAASAWNGLRPHGRGVLIAIGVAGACHFVAAFTAHMLIGYTNPVHLFPVYWGATVLALAIVLLRRPVTRPVERMPGFPDV